MKPPTSLSPCKIGVDILGNDHSPEKLLHALLQMPLPPGVDLLILGSPDLAPESPSFLPCPEEPVSMSDPPVSAFKKKRFASLFLGLQLLKEKKIDAFISAGNTGALILGSKMILSFLPSIQKPAFLSLLPTKKKPVAVLDLGASVHCKAKHLVHFAQMGAAYLRIHGRPLPKIGLLNIGEEPLKGTSELKLSYQQLLTFPNPPFQFVGNVEGKSAFEGEVDALVTDGFSGNIFLKTAEGVASLFLDLAGPHRADLLKRLHYPEYQGALLIGVQGIVIKCHGYSSPPAFEAAIREAISLVQMEWMKQLERVKFI